jgi:PAS domain S-box-containing protein
LQRISKLYQHLEELKVQTLSDPYQVSKILSDISNELQVVKALLDENRHINERRDQELAQHNLVFKQLPADAKVADAADEMVNEEAPGVSEEINKFLFENAEDGIALYVLPLDGQPGKFSHVNEALCEMLGYSKEELCRLTLADIIEEGQSYSKEEMQKVASHDKSTVSEKTFISKDGGKIPAEILKTLIDLKGYPAAFLRIRDIADRRRMEEKLQASRDFLYKIINSIADPIFVKEGSTGIYW